VDDLDLALRAARAGAEVVRAGFGSVTAAELKGANDPVTEIDRRSEEAIVSMLRAERPSDAVIAEEGAGVAGGSRRWYVDPLDGTVNFVHGIPQVSVSVAVYDEDGGLAAVVIDPLREETFSAVRGRGATLNGAPITVSRAAELRGTVVATGFFYDHDRYADEYARPVAAVLARVNGIRRFGSAALDLAWTAAGRFDGYWELGVAPWDTAAGALLVREAGGLVTDPYGTEAKPETRLVVAAAPGVHEALRSIIEGTLPERLRSS
jgi:myo-inositol-1(or 4)-monophosphatase